MPRSKAAHPSHAEEVDLIVRAQAGDLRARDEIIERHMGMIRWHTARTVGGENVDEYLSYSIEAVLRAIKHFDVRRRVRFMSYAAQGIWRLCYRAKKRDGLIRLPKEADVSEKWKHHAEASKRVLRLDAPRHHDDSATLHDRIGKPDGWIEREHEVWERKRRINHVRRFLAALPERERLVLEYRMEGRTHADIAPLIGVSRGRVHQLQVAAMEKLKRHGDVPDSDICIINARLTRHKRI